MERERTKPGDPEFGVYAEVVKWNNTILCLPTWEEILEYEYVRQRGEINMLTEDVQRYAFDHGLYALVTWWQRCKEARISPWKMYEAGIVQYEAENGSRESWITDEMRENVLLRELERKEQ
jgi:hypothetical protein